MDDVFFLDRDGNRLHSDVIASHIGLARCIVDRNEALKEEFESTHQQDPCDFLINKGYMKVTNMQYYRRAVYHSQKISEKQRDWLLYLSEEGYDLDDLFITEQMKKAQEQIKE